MASGNKHQQFVEDVAHKVHNLSSDQLVAALTGAANAPVAANETLAALVEIAYTNLSSRNITTTSSAQTSGTYKLTLTDLTLTASGTVEAFRYVDLFNDTPTSPADPLIAWYDHGEEVALENGEQFTIDFDGTNGFLQLV